MADKQYADLLDYLLCEAGSPDVGGIPTEEPAPEAVQQFIARARKLLQTNQPVTVDVGAGVLTIRLQDSTILPVVAGVAESTGGDMGYVPVTKPKEGPGTRQQGMQGGFSFGITGAK